MSEFTDSNIGFRPKLKVSMFHKLLKTDHVKLLNAELKKSEMCQLTQVENDDEIEKTIGVF